MSYTDMSCHAIMEGSVARVKQDFALLLAGRAKAREPAVLLARVVKQGCRRGRIARLHARSCSQMTGLSLPSVCRRRLGCRCREVHFGHRARTLRSREVGVVGFESHASSKEAGRKLLHVGVVILQRVVVALALHCNAVFRACKFVLQAEEILARP